MTKTRSEAVDFTQLVHEWANAISVSVEDITFTVITDYAQYGNVFPVMIQLYLPSIWKKQSIEEIQSSLAQHMVRHLDIQPHELFIFTTIISSGHVLSNGKIERW